MRIANYTSYNGINQVGEVNGVGMTYDANGNLTNDGTNTYVWDRANRLLSVGSSSYAYDGLGNRIQQTVSGTATKYLLDMQPGLTQVLAATTGANTDRYLHSLHGIHAMKNNAGEWIWPTQDGLGNVRQEVSDALAVNGVRSNEPFLTPFDEQGSFGMPFGATGEMVDVTGQVYLRNRYLSPTLGQFVSLDPLETPNRYAYVNGNPVNYTDPLGLYPCLDPVTFLLTECPDPIYPPILVSPTQIPPVVVQPPQTTTKDGKYCKEHPDDPECEEYWDDNDPNGCGCRTNYYPTSSHEFSSTTDMLCNLNCYNGGIFRTAYYLMAAKGLDFSILPNPEGQIAGIFLERGRRLGNQSDAFHYFLRRQDYVDADIETFANYNNAVGGTIGVRDPGEGFANRATRLATLVEEITHAALYHFGDCPNISVRTNEYVAKSAKVAWIAISGIPIVAFANTQSVYQDVINSVSSLSNSDPAFINCPGQVSLSESGTFQMISDSGCITSLGCIDPLVKNTIKYSLI